MTDIDTEELVKKFMRKADYLKSLDVRSVGQDSHISDLECAISAITAYLSVQEGVALSAEQIAYAALWRIISDNPTLNAARRELLDMIGGLRSCGQRDAVQWATNYFLPVSDAEVLSIDFEDAVRPPQDSVPVSEGLKESRDVLGITEKQQRQKILAAKTRLEIQHCREKHPGKDCLAIVVSTTPMYNCAYGGRPMDDPDHALTKGDG